MPTDSLIANVSDTARWVAAYRASESARPDALFHDPYAERLAGERGRAIAAKVAGPFRSGWPTIVRTRLIDDLILASVAQGCDLVLSLAAGFDTRPYRLTWPESLEWVEVDLPPLIEEKDRLLAAEKPRCKLRREGVDLADPAVRRSFLERACGGAKSALVVTEGLLAYLGSDVVEAMAADFTARPGIRWWLTDVASPGSLRMSKRNVGADMSRAQLTFAPADGVAFFERRGWNALDIRSTFREARRLGRLPLRLQLGELLPAPDPRMPGDRRWAATVRFERAAR